MDGKDTTSNSSRPRITVLGSLNVDLVSYVSKHPQAGETLKSNGFETSFGGKGANQAVACGKLSRTSSLASPIADIAMLGAVGSDAYGDPMKKSLTANGVDVSGIQVVQGGKTGVAVIVVEESTGQNRIIFSPETNYSLRPENYRAFPGPRPDLLVMQLEIPLDTVLQAISTAHDQGVPVLLNPAPAVPLPEEVYEKLTHFIMNETEALLLSGMEESSLDDEEGLQRLAKYFLDKKVRYVVITLGGRGVYYATSSGQSGLIPARKVKVVDTTAAGDTFIGSYALSVVTSLSTEFDIAKAVELANRASAITVSRKGAQASVPWKEEIF